MMKQLLDTVRVGRPTGRRIADHTPDGSMAREADDPTRIQTSRTTVNVSSETRYPLSWPARDLARSRRLPPRDDDATIMVDGARTDRGRSGSPRK